VSLRNPADRAYSSYLGRICGALERSGVEEAMRPTTYYFETSLYHPRLSRYFDRFDRNRIKVIIFDDLVANPGAVVRELLDFLQIDGTVATDVSTLHNEGRVPRFMVLNEAILSAGLVARRVLPRTMPATGLVARTQRLLFRAPDPLPLLIRQRMLRQFSEDVARTGTLIGRDLSHWLE
jgi:hypothetical protein